MRPETRSGKQTPAQRLPGVERDHAADLTGHPTCDALERERPFVEREAVEVRAVYARKGFELVESALFFEHRRIAFERVRRVENAGAAARRFLGFAGVRRAVG